MTELPAVAGLGARLCEAKFDCIRPGNVMLPTPTASASSVALNADEHNVDAATLAAFIHPHALHFCALDLLPNHRNDVGQGRHHLDGRLLRGA